ncbi:MAG: hypothetical protein WCW04_03760 [Candidatus Paceibacterota bacterium]|jgi:hypothetical protein
MNIYSQEKIVKTNKIILELTPSEADFLARFWGRHAGQDRASAVNKSEYIFPNAVIEEQTNINDNLYWQLMAEILKVVDTKLKN